MDAVREHLKDRFGNEVVFSIGDGTRFPPVDNIPNHDKQLQKIKDMELRSDDVIVVAYPKSGNNWIHHLTTMLIENTTNARPVLADEHYVLLDECGEDQHLPPPTKPRTLWSHLLFRHLPRDVVEKKVKIVYMTRNPKDVFVSLYCFLKNFGPPLGYSGTWAQFFSFMLEHGWWYGDWFRYVREWEKEIQDHPDVPIFTLTYEDLIQDSLGQVEKLNEFLGTKRDREFCQLVSDTCRFSNMHKTRQLDQQFMEEVAHWKKDVSLDAFYRKGVIGDWKNWFTVAQNEEFDKVFHSKMAGSKTKFVFE